MHRKAVQKELGDNECSTQVMRVLALLVESGAAYCVLWVRVPIVFFTTRRCADARRAIALRAHHQHRTQLPNRDASLAPHL